jgi:hypothetical protein
VVLVVGIAVATVVAILLVATIAIYLRDSRCFSHTRVTMATVSQKAKLKPFI